MLVVVHNVGRCDGVRVVEALRVGRVVVALQVLLVCGHHRVAVATARDGGNHRSRAQFADAVLHAQLEEDILERAEPVEAKQVLGRLLGQQMT